MKRYHIPAGTPVLRRPGNLDDWESGTYEHCVTTKPVVYDHTDIHQDPGGAAGGFYFFKLPPEAAPFVLLAIIRGNRVRRYFVPAGTLVKRFTNRDPCTNSFDCETIRTTKAVTYDEEDFNGESLTGNESMKRFYFILPSLASPYTLLSVAKAKVVVTEE